MKSKKHIKGQRSKSMDEKHGRREWRVVIVLNWVTSLQRRFSSLMTSVFNAAEAKIKEQHKDKQG